MSDICIMFLFKKVEDSNKPDAESAVPETNVMDRGENIPLYVGEADINSIDYDSEDGLDEDLDEDLNEDDVPFEPFPHIVERRDTVFSLEMENQTKEEVSNDEESTLPEVIIESKIEESCIAKLCKFLSKCFTWSK